MVVKLRNIATGQEYESAATDSLGSFEVEDIERGLYIFGAMTAEGNYNAGDVIGIDGGEAAKIAIALAQYEAQQTGDGEPPWIRGEDFVGLVLSYDPATREARIQIKRGILERNDNLHFLGPKEKGSLTDFYQKAKLVRVEGNLVTRALAGQVLTITLDKPVLENDWVYMKECRGLTTPSRYEIQEAAPGEPPWIRGEDFLGRIVSYNPTTKEALVYVEQGELDERDNVHLFGNRDLGSETDFYQKAKSFKIDGRTVLRIIAGQTFTMALENAALENDWVYLKEECRGLAWIFFGPVGIITLLAGATTAAILIITPGDASPFRH